MCFTEHKVDLIPLKLAVVALLRETFGKDI